MTCIIVATELAPSDTELAAFVRTALGPHGEDVSKASAADSGVIGELAGRLEAPGAIGVAVLHSGDTTVALCLGSLRRR